MNILNFSRTKKNTTNLEEIIYVRPYCFESDKKAQEWLDVDRYAVSVKQTSVQ